jgi:hypothetical protein
VRDGCGDHRREKNRDSRSKVSTGGYSSSSLPHTHAAIRRTSGSGEPPIPTDGRADPAQNHRRLVGGLDRSYSRRARRAKSRGAALSQSAHFASPAGGYSFSSHSKSKIPSSRLRAPLRPLRLRGKISSRSHRRSQSAATFRPPFGGKVGGPGRIRSTLIPPDSSRLSFAKPGATLSLEKPRTSMDIPNCQSPNQLAYSRRDCPI